MHGVAVTDWDGRIETIAKQLERSPFGRVFLCVEERHVKYRQGNVREAVARLRDTGKEVYLDPWGVGGIFAGETLGTTPVAFEYWCQMYERTEADGIFLDEPAPVHRLDDLVWMTDNAPVILGLQPERDFSDLPRHNGLAVSTYLFPPRPEHIGMEGVLDQIDEWHHDLPLYASVWVQTFQLADQEWLPRVAINEWLSLGRDINLWSWESCATVSSIRPFNHEKVWREVLDAFKDWGF